MIKFKIPEVIKQMQILSKVKMKLESARDDLKTLLAKEMAKTFIPFKEAKFHLGNGVYVSFEYSTQEELLEFSNTLAQVAAEAAKDLSK